MSLPPSAPMVIDDPSASIIARERDGMKILTSEELAHELASLRNFLLASETQMRRLTDPTQGHSTSMRKSNIKPLPDRLARFVVFGSNSAGKSSLLHFLLAESDQGAFLPAGAGKKTGRICSVRYAPMDGAQLKVISPSSGSTTPLLGHQGLRSQLGPFLRRPTEEEELQDWSRSRVEVHWPFEWLKPGIELVDLPGSAQNDSPVLMENVALYIRDMDIAGIIFVYGNPTFGDDSIESWKQLRAMLENRAKFIRHRIPIFFASSHFDVQHMKFASDSLEDAQKDLARLALDRFQMLQNAANNPECAAYGLTVSEPAFGAFSGTEYLELADEPEPNLHLEACSRYCQSGFLMKLMRWMVASNASRHKAYVSHLIGKSTWVVDRMSALASSRSTLTTQRNMVSSYTMLITRLVTLITSGEPPTERSPPNVAFIAQRALKSDKLVEKLEEYVKSISFSERRHKVRQSMTALRDDVIDAATRLRQRYHVPTLVSWDQYVIDEIFSEASTLIAEFVVMEVKKEGIPSWTNTIIAVINQAFSSPNMHHTPIAAISNLVDAARPSSSEQTRSPSDTFPPALQDLGWRDFICAVENVLKEHIQASIAKYWKAIGQSPAVPVTNLEEIMLRCLHACGHIDWRNSDLTFQCLRSLEPANMALRSAVDDELAEVARYEQSANRIHESDLPLRHAASISQSWNYYEFVSDIGDGAPLLHTLALGSPLTSSFHMSTISLLKETLNHYDVVYHNVDLNYLKMLYQMIKLLDSGGSQHMLFPTQIALNREGPTLTACHYYAESEMRWTHGGPQRPLDKLEMLGALIRASDTTQLCIGAGITEMTLSLSDVTIWSRNAEPNWRVGRAGAWTELRNGRLVPLPPNKLKSSPIDAFLSFYTSICQSISSMDAALDAAMRDIDSRLRNTRSPKDALDTLKYVRSKLGPFSSKKPSS